MSNTSDIIQNGNFVIVKKTFEDSYRLARITKDKRCYFGKQRLELGSIIGQPFGSTFELTKNFHLNLLDDSQIKLSIDRDTETHRDNRNVTDNNESQKLSRDDIEALKKENLGAHELIKTIVENSSTFGEKNKHSQDKYLAKKQVKHMSFFTMLRPTTRQLMEMYYASGPGKNCHIRIDTLAQILHLSNVMYDGKYMVVDTNLGLVSAGCFERMGGKGRIVQFTLEEQVHSGMRQSVEALNFSPESIKDSFTCLSIYDLYDPMLNCDPSTIETPNVVPVTDEKGDSNSMNEGENENGQEPEQESQEEGEGMEEDEGENKPENGGGNRKRPNKFSPADHEARRLARMEDIRKTKQLLEENDMDALIIVAAEHHPKSAMNLLYKYLGSSRPFVVYSPIVEPLVEIYNTLKDSAFYLKISQTWLRQYQVLECRTRPDMLMEGASGYLLTGFKAAQ